MTNYTLILAPGESVNVASTTGFVGDPATNIILTAASPAPPPPTGQNMLLNPYFENPMPNGKGWKYSEFPGWKQDNGTWMWSRKKDAETSPVPADTAIEFDIDSNGGWSVGQSDAIYQAVNVAPGTYKNVYAGIFGIHHVYQGQMTLRLSAHNPIDDNWYVLGMWQLRNPDGSYNMPMATKTERIWREMSVSLAGESPLQYDQLEIRITGKLGSTMDGMKMSGAFLAIS